MHSLFSTQVYQKKIRFDLVDLLSEIELIKKSDQAGQIWSRTNYKKGYTSYGSLDKLHKLSSTIYGLEQKINTHVNQYLKSLNYEASVGRNLVMTDCWVNIMPSGAHHAAHIHPHSVISGVFYVAVPAGASAIKFEDPRLGLFMNAPVLKKNARREQLRFVNLQPKAGDLVLFESWLKHEVPTNLSKQPRVSLSFNYGWC